MSQPIPQKSLSYERYVDELCKTNAEMVAALELHYASHVAFEHGDDAEAERQYALAIERTRSILAKVN